MKRVNNIVKKLVEGMEKGKLARVKGLFSNTDPNTDPIQPKTNSNDPVLQRATPVENEVVLNAEIVELKLQIEGLKRLIASNPVAYRALTDDIPKGVKVAKEGLEPPTRGL